MINGDRTKAMALELAERRLTKLGWRVTFSDIGEHAALILNAMNRKLEEEIK